MYGLHAWFSDFYANVRKLTLMRNESTGGSDVRRQVHEDCAVFIILFMYFLFYEVLLGKFMRFMRFKGFSKRFFPRLEETNERGEVGVSWCYIMHAELYIHVTGS